jgi:SAM-dependent methyltransferase
MNDPSRTPQRFFDDLYGADEDPWRYASSRYERRKYAHTVAVLGRARFSRALEVGCSIGVFTRLLADRCEQVVGIDLSPRAISLAQARLTDVPNADVRVAAFPDEMPEGPWDLIVCSEILNYLDAPRMAAACELLQAALQAGTTVVAVHYRGGSPTSGEQVHARLRSELAPWHAVASRRPTWQALTGRRPRLRPQYRLDRFDPAQAVAV